MVSAKEMASALNVSEAHLAKVLQRLAREGIVRSVRGPKGGFRLARDGDKVSLLEVYEAVEGPVRASSCMLGGPACTGEDCILGGLVESLNNDVKDHLQKTTVGGMAHLLAARNPGVAAGGGEGGQG
jgi:Rrf2 family protein